MYEIAGYTSAFEEIQSAICWIQYWIR